MYTFHQIQSDFIRVSRPHGSHARLTVQAGDRSTLWTALRHTYDIRVDADSQGQGKWPSRAEQAKASHPEDKRENQGLGIQSLYGKTAGMLVSRGVLPVHQCQRVMLPYGLQTPVIKGW